MYPFLFHVLLQHFLRLKHRIPGGTNACVHFIETSPSVLGGAPWLRVMQYEVKRKYYRPIIM